MPVIILRPHIATYSRRNYGTASSRTACQLLSSPSETRVGCFVISWITATVSFLRALLCCFHAPLRTLGNTCDSKVPSHPVSCATSLASQTRAHPGCMAVLLTRGCCSFQGNATCAKKSQRAHQHRYIANYTCVPSVKFAFIHFILYSYTSRESCKRRFFRSEVDVLHSHRDSLPAHVMKPDRFIVPWLPRIAYTRARRRAGVLIHDLKSARREYQREVISPATRKERERRKKALFKRYSYRSRLSKVLFTFQCYIDDWSRKLARFEKGTTCAKSRRLDESALIKRRIPASIMHEPTTRSRRSVIRRPQGLQHIATLQLRSAALSKLRSSRRKCDHCGVVVSALRLDAHVAQYHPGQLPESRPDVETGELKYRCELCEENPLKWYTALSVQAHQYHKHGIRVPQTKECSNIIEL